jgi:F-type H+/Na+-transporting ATPase subunit beta
MATETVDRNKGEVVQVLGAVVDVEFSPGNMPEIYDALRVPREGQDDLILEVQTDLGKNRVRALAMAATDGMSRGVDAIATGDPIKVPVGQSSLGRIFNVLGQPVDGKGPVEADSYYPIHRDAPLFSEQSTSRKCSRRD